MTDSDNSNDAIEVDGRASDLSIRPRENLSNSMPDGTMDLSTTARRRPRDYPSASPVATDLSGSRRFHSESSSHRRERTHSNSVPSPHHRSTLGSSASSIFGLDNSRHRRRVHSSGQHHYQMPTVAPAPHTNSVDVIDLSDEESNRLNGHLNGFSSGSRPTSPEGPHQLPPPLPRPKLTEEESLEKELTLRQLQEELRNEEMKLVLLKKLRQSQLLKENLNATTSTSNTSAGTQGGTTLPVSNNKSLSGRALPQLNTGLPSSHIRSGSKGHSMSSSQPSSLLTSSMNHSITVNSNQRSLSSVLPPGILAQQSLRGGSSRSATTTPPNIAGYQGSKLNPVPATNSNVQASSPQPSGQLERLETQTPAQRQAAAKLALRKQLEKTLLQIPPPKPPPPEMHFIPNANNQEFVYLLGLEVVVGFLVGDEQCNKPPPDPFDCVQCTTDFTPVWKWQDAGEKKKPPAVICESCVTNNIKKALKAEHTNRLKTAFVKALQQEQEIEQRMSQGGGISPPLTISTPPPPLALGSNGGSLSLVNHRASTPPNSHSPLHHARSSSGAGMGSSAAVAAAVANSAALLQQMPKLSAAHQSLLQAQHFQQLAQSLPGGGGHPQPAHMLPFGPLLAAQAYSYQMLGKSSLSSSDLQRQYLLDMIPPRSMSQSSMNWKT